MTDYIRSPYSCQDTIADFVEMGRDLAACGYHLRNVTQIMRNSVILFFVQIFV